jgi:hypothetical protein
VAKLPAALSRLPEARESVSHEPAEAWLATCHSGGPHENVPPARITQLQRLCHLSSTHRPLDTRAGRLFHAVVVVQHALNELDDLSLPCPRLPSHLQDGFDPVLRVVAGAARAHARLIDGLNERSDALVLLPQSLLALPLAIGVPCRRARARISRCLLRMSLRNSGSVWRGSSGVPPCARNPACALQQHLRLLVARQSVGLVRHDHVARQAEELQRLDQISAL